MKKFPASFINKLDQILPLAADRSLFVESLLHEPPTSIRYHPVKSQKSIFENEEKIPWCSQGFYLGKRPSFTLDPFFHAGCYYVQESSSMILDYLCKVLVSGNKPLKILDLCAAPGGKSTLLASVLNKNDLLISNEVNRSRAEILSENVQKWGYSNHWVTCNTPKQFGENLPDFFDIILVDAPCSGEGMFRKLDHSIDEWSEDNVKKCHVRQTEILQDVWPALKNEGLLIYSTCTYNTIENEETIRSFSSTHSCSSKAVNFPSEWKIQGYENQKQIVYRCLPHLVKGEGFTFSILQKEETSPHKQKIKSKAVKLTTTGGSAEYLSKDQSFIQFQQDDLLFAIPEYHVESYKLSSSMLYYLKKGIHIGTLKSKGMIWDPMLSLSLDLNLAFFEKIQLDKEQCLDLLRLQNPPLPALEKTNEGWVCFMFQDIPLGWLKNMRTRYNNYYPNHWKIRLSK